MSQTHRRICILGNSGSGKSTLAAALSKKLKIEVIHLDKQLLDKNLEKLPDTVYRQIHADLIGKEDWIIDGNYMRVFPERANRATLVIFLDVGRLVAVPRVFRRARFSRQHQATLPEGAPSLKLSRSFLLWILTWNRRRRLREVKKICETANVPLLAVGSASLNQQVITVTDFLTRQEKSTSVY